MLGLGLLGLGFGIGLGIGLWIGFRTVAIIRLRFRGIRDIFVKFHVSGWIFA
jgi:hypothetical protein